MPLGGPDGGDGGNGGNICIVADRSITTLNYFRRKRSFKAVSGKSGGKQKKHGATGDDLVIKVPLGTMIFLKEEEREVLLVDLSQQGQKVLVAKGGSGGLGNVHFATSTNQAPKTATEGKPGEEYRIVLDLKLIADVGIIGYPNVGKSTLLAAVSKAKPKIADYPFTTLQPYLGIVKVGNYKSFVMADIPGIIEGASEGKGLGFQFLKYIDRNRLLIFLIDSQNKEPVKTLNLLREELYTYNSALKEKPYIK